MSSVPKTHFERPYGGIYCNRIKGWKWRFTTPIPKEVTCKHCIARMNENGLFDPIDPYEEGR